MATNFFGMKKSDSFGALNGMMAFDDGFEYSLGPPESGFSLFLAERTKKVHFIRHAEGYHNVATKETGSNECLLRGDEPAASHDLHDARLTRRGIEQAESLRSYLSARPSGSRSFTAFDLVVVSPLARTCETALRVFGRPREPGRPAFLDRRDAPVNSAEYASGLKVARPRFLVREECRERWGHYVCDGRRSIRDIVKEFPDFDWSEIVHDDDVFYTDDRESDEHCCDRAVKFLEWLNSRPEKCIAVVTHSSFLRHLFGQFGEQLHEDDRDDLQLLAGNCELRSIVLCSHGNKDGKKLDPLVPPSLAPSTVRMKTIVGKEESLPLNPWPEIVTIE